MPASNHKQESAAISVEEPTRATCESTSLVGKAAEKAKEAATFVGEKAEQATEAVGAGMESVGRVIREHEPHQGMLHNAGEAVADKLEGAGRYLETHGLKGIGDDMTNLIRRNPVPALLVGVGLGIILARMMRS